MITRLATGACEAWRVVAATYADSAFDCEGARRSGGRFNAAGTRVVYAAATLALALFGIGESAAVAYSIVFQLCLLATVIPLAALAAASHRAEFRSARSALVR